MAPKKKSTSAAPKKKEEAPSAQTTPLDTVVKEISEPVKSIV